MTILCIGMIVYGLSSYAKLDGLHSAAGYLVTPFQKGMSTVGKLLKGTTLSFADVEELQQKNEELQKRVNELTEQNNLLLQDQMSLCYHYRFLNSIHQQALGYILLLQYR